MVVCAFKVVQGRSIALSGSAKRRTPGEQVINQGRLAKLSFLSLVASCREVHARAP